MKTSELKMKVVNDCVKIVSVCSFDKARHCEHGLSQRSRECHHQMIRELAKTFVRWPSQSQRTWKTNNLRMLSD